MSFLRHLIILQTIMITDCSDYLLTYIDPMTFLLEVVTLRYRSCRSGCEEIACLIITIQITILGQHSACLVHISHLIWLCGIEETFDWNGRLIGWWSLQLTGNWNLMTLL